MHQVTNLGRRRLDIELRRVADARRFESIAPRQTLTLDIDPSEPTNVASVAAGLICISAVEEAAIETAPMPRRLGVRLARKQTASPPAAASEKDHSNE